MANNTIHFSSAFIIFLENITETKINQNIELYFLRNVSTCCYGNTFGCADENRAYFNYPYEHFNDVHELSHVFFNIINTELYYDFEEIFISKIRDLYDYSEGKEMHQFSRLLNCSAQNLWVVNCSEKGIFSKSGKFEQCLIRKIDCYYALDDDILEFNLWIDFLQNLVKKGGIKNKTDLFEVLEHTFPNVSRKISHS